MSAPRVQLQVADSRKPGFVGEISWVRAFAIDKRRGKVYGDDMSFPAPTGERKVRVLRTTQTREYYVDSKNPMLDHWYTSGTTTEILWVKNLRDDDYILDLS